MKSESNVVKCVEIEVENLTNDLLRHVITESQFASKLIELQTKYGVTFS